MKNPQIIPEAVMPLQIFDLNVMIIMVKVVAPGIWLRALQSLRPLHAVSVATADIKRDRIASSPMPKT